ncbi:MAG: hypothetical protein SVZ03_03935 [Spirochaetota bacterium]|nr:hypothetical protein [Spirochaetota bacterium]
MLKNRIVYLLLAYSFDLLFILILVFIAISLSNIGLGGIYFVAYFFIIIIGSLPLLSFIHETIGSVIIPIKFEDLYVQTVDSILNVEFFDEMLRSTFNQILELINARMGLIVFYNQKSDKFDIFYHKNKKRRIIRGAKIELNNILYKLINGPDDIIIKSKLDPSVPFLKAVINEIEKFNGELIVPIYYQETFLGIIVIGDRKRKYSKIEIIFMRIINWFPIPSVTGISEKGEERLLKIFASKIAILSVNSFFFLHFLEKKELEKEYELASKIQKKIFPNPNIQVGRISIIVYHKTTSLTTKEYYDVFTNDKIKDEVRISTFRIRENIKGTSVLMPGIQAANQSYARLGFKPSKAVLQLKKMIKDKNLLDNDLMIFHSSLNQNGKFVYFNNRYTTPMLFNKNSKDIQSLKKNGKSKDNTITIRSGEIVIITCEIFYKIINDDISKYSSILYNNYQASLNEIKSILIKSILKTNKDDNEEMDKLLILIRFEECLD